MVFTYYLTYAYIETVSWSLLEITIQHLIPFPLIKWQNPKSVFSSVRVILVNASCIISTAGLLTGIQIYFLLLQN